MNDSFRTDVFVRWHPETIACACIYLAARQLQVSGSHFHEDKGVKDLSNFCRNPLDTEC